MRPLSEANPRLLCFLEQRRDKWKPTPAPLARYLQLKRGSGDTQASE